MFAQPLVDTKAPPRRPRHGAPVASSEFFGREATVLTLALTGLECHVVAVTARLEEGPAAFEIVGLPEARVRETRVRVRAGLQSVGSELPAERLMIRFDHPELALGGAADTAIAVAVLAVIGRIDPRELKGIAIVGELSLTGVIRTVRGVLPMVRSAAAREVRQVIVPKENGNEAAHAEGVPVSLAEHLFEIVRHFQEGVPLEKPEGLPTTPVPPAVPDLSEIRGMLSARRAFEIAAAGAHAILVIGPPGAGKTMLVRRLPGILPDPTAEEALEMTSIFSIAGLLPERGFVATRPFRAPHHTVSAAGVLGGGDLVRPGEVTLAHNGVLFLDEVVEFRASTLESLAHVLRDGHATIIRGGKRTSFPAGAQLVCGANPCPCGYQGTTSSRCTCSPERVARYLARLRGPLIERIDVRLVLPAVEVSDIRRAEPSEPSAIVRARVTAARAVQAERAKVAGAAAKNAALAAPDLERFAALDAAGARVLAEAKERLDLSAAARDRALRVARTIADLDGSDAVRAAHVAEGVALASSEDARPTPGVRAGGEDAA